MAKTFEITLGPKNREHTTVEFTPEKQIEAASVYSEQLDCWVYLNEEQLEKLADQNVVQTAMAEHLYQIRNEAI